MNLTFNPVVFAGNKPGKKKTKKETAAEPPAAPTQPVDPFKQFILDIYDFADKNKVEVNVLTGYSEEVEILVRSKEDVDKLVQAYKDAGARIEESGMYGMNGYEVTRRTIYVEGAPEDYSGKPTGLRVRQEMRAYPA